MPGNAGTPESQKPADSGGRDSALPSISLPKGGGAIRGIDEKFAANSVTGTGSMSVPIATSPGRSGFGPQLALSYDSGAGNGPFGFGWSLSLPRISRKTDKGLPRYRDAGSPDADDSDVFLLSGAEDLVPVLEESADGTWQQPEPLERTIGGDKYDVRRYRPRIEGLFARIERWESDGDVHWRSLSRDNVLTLYGRDVDSRIADPEHPERIFTWLICETRDDKGNAVVYEYEKEDGAGVVLGRACERNRGPAADPRRTANRYLERICYGNRVPLLDDEGRRPRFLTDLPADRTSDPGWMFEVVFDYGEHHPDDDERHVAAPVPRAGGEWTYRADPFSTYRAGFEVRTCRLCQRVLMFHHFPEEPDVDKDCLVRSTDFTYAYEDPAGAPNPVYTFLREVTQSGYRRDGDGYLKRSLPPVEFTYSEPAVQDTVEEVDAESLENLPVGVDGAAYRWTDLHGEGIPGVLSEQAGGWYYKRNLSPASDEPTCPVELAPLVDSPPAKAAPGPAALPAPDAGAPPPAGQSDLGTRPRIVITCRRHQVNDQAMAALAAGADLFERRGTLVELVRYPGAPPSPHRIREPRLEELLSRHCEFVEPGREGGEPSEAAPPRWTTRGLLARGRWPELPQLAEGAEAPAAAECSTPIRVGAAQRGGPRSPEAKAGRTSDALPGRPHGAAPTETSPASAEDLLEALDPVLATLGGSATARRILAALADEPDRFPDLAAAFERLAPGLDPGDPAAPAVLGYALRPLKGRRHAGRVLAEKSRASGGLVWTVIPAPPGALSTHSDTKENHAMFADLMDSTGPSRADLEELEHIERHRRGFRRLQPKNEHQTVVRARLLQLYDELEETVCEQSHKSPFLAEVWQRVDELEARYWQGTAKPEAAEDSPRERRGGARKPIAGAVSRRRTADPARPSPTPGEATETPLTANESTPTPKAA